METSRRLIQTATSTNWLVKFTNGETAIEWAYSREAVWSLMRSRYGSQARSFVQSIDRE